MKVLTKTCSCHAHAVTLPHKRRRESKQMHSCTGCRFLDTAKMPSIAKKIHREDPAHLGHQPHMAMAVAHHHFP
jgi:hypothetical protein